MRYTGPRNRIARRENLDLGLKTSGSKAHASLLKKLNIKPGQHGAGRGKRRRKDTEHAKQLRVKQKWAYMFGVNECKLKQYFKTSSRKKGNTAIHLGELLERRLDNVIYRLGYTPTRAAARQLVNHGHVNVNESTVSIASYQVRNGEKIEFAKKETREIPYIAEFQSQTDPIIPEWLTAKKTSGTITSTPDNSIISQQINLRLVIEFYSR